MKWQLSAAQSPHLSPLPFAQGGRGEQIADRCELSQFYQQHSRY